MPNEEPTRALMVPLVEALPQLLRVETPKEMLPVEIFQLVIKDGLINESFQWMNRVRENKAIEVSVGLLEAFRMGLMLQASHDFEELRQVFFSEIMEQNRIEAIPMEKWGAVKGGSTNWKENFSWFEVDEYTMKIPLEVRKIIQMLRGLPSRGFPIDDCRIIVPKGYHPGGANLVAKIGSGWFVVYHWPEEKILSSFRRLTPKK